MDSAILAFCSTSSTVMPCSCNLRMMEKISLTSFGDRPMDGSSISTVFGWLISARPIANICCSPPDNVPAFCVRRSFRRGNMSKTMSRSFAMDDWSFKLYAPISRFSCTLMRVNTWRPSGMCAMPSRTMSWLWVLSRSVPLNITEPDCAGTSPVMACSVVVLPAPFAPINDTISPSFTVRLMPLTASMAP